MGGTLANDGSGVTQAYENLITDGAANDGYGVPLDWYLWEGLHRQAPGLATQDLGLDGLVNWQKYLYGANPQVSLGFAVWIAEPAGKKRDSMKKQRENVKNLMARSLCVLAVAAAFLFPAQAWGAGACTCARFNDFRDMGCHKTPGGPGAPASGANNAGGNNTKCPTCPPETPLLAGPDSSTPDISNTGMPRWWVDEPYINLHVSDTPLLYRASSGKPINFSFFYKQRYMTPELDQLPTMFEPYTGVYRLSDFQPYVYDMRWFGGTNSVDHGMTNAAWSHNWMMDIVFWDAHWESSYWNGSPNWLFAGSTPLYSDSYEALLFNPDSGISYFTSNAASQHLNSATQLSDPVSQVQFTCFPHSYPDITNTGPYDAKGIYSGQHNKWD